VGVSVRATLDHLVVACRDLTQGVAWLRKQLGEGAQPGGKHKLMGSHNAVLRLGARTYLELIAIDPNAPTPSRPRWFGLDEAAVQKRASSAPFLASWVVACTDIAAAAQRVPELGEIVALSRGMLSWRITIPADGRLPLGGALPAVIQWDDAIHPCDALEDRGCALKRLRIVHPRADFLRAALLALGLDAPYEVEPGELALVTRIDTPRGEASLS
jgi:hypothetical protein